MNFKTIFHSTVFVAVLFAILFSSAATVEAGATLSDQDLLGARQRFLANQTDRAASADTLRIAALRVEFVEDQVETTTGNGLFDLSTESDYKIDKPPHNKLYFEQQLLALHNYFNTVSNQHLFLLYDVYPAGDNSAFSLPHDMVYYSGEEDEEQQKLRWSELLRDALHAADDEVAFDQYDIYIIFHAGVGNDFAFDFDATPYDIQSAFIDFETLSQTLGAETSDFQGIETGETVVREAIILPESQNQEGYDIGLLGSMALLMGSQLGMPSLFDTETGRAGIGQWGLMDQGSNNLQGLIPSRPCAWTRLYMGWQQAIELSMGMDIPLGCPQTSETRVYKIPITANEYYLVENRQIDLNGDGLTYGRDANGNRAEFDTTGQVLLEENTDVLVRIDEYDFGLPGSGILIWHIDENVIRENLESNTINNNREHRGVDLVECDGAQDIGYYYDMFDPGYGTESGDYFDPYWAGNASHKIVNDTALVEFSSASIPASRSFNGAYTHIKLFDFSSSDSIMTFSLDSDLAVPGFPQATGKDFQVGSLLTLPAQQGALVAAVNQGGEIMIWKHNGEKAIANDQTLTYSTADNKRRTYDWALAFQMPDSVDLEMATTRSYEQLVIADRSGHVRLINPADSDQDGVADVHSQIDLDEKPTAGPLVLADDAGGSTIFIGTRAGNLFSLSSDGQAGYDISTRVQIDQTPVVALAHGGSDRVAVIAVTASGAVYGLDKALQIAWQQTCSSSCCDFQSLVADFDGSAGYEVAVISQQGELFGFSAAGDRLFEHAIAHHRQRQSPAAPADIDEDGLPEIIYHSQGSVVALNWNGSAAVNFPHDYFLEPDSSAPFSALPLWSGNQGGELYTLTPSGRLYALDRRGRILSGYPVPAGNRITASGIMADLDTDADMELLALSGDGFLYARDLPVQPDAESSWYQVGRDNFRTHFLPGNQEAGEPLADLMPHKGVYCYPNPVYDPLTYIRYELNREANTVSVRIYDLSGDFVETVPATGRSRGVHEIAWSVDHVQSGVYLARIEAVSTQETSMKIIKIAVIK